MEALAVSDLNFTYPTGLNALRGISFTLDEGELLLVCGATGSGKSTLLRELDPRIRPHGTRSGKALLFGRDIELSEPREIGFVSQDPSGMLVADTVGRELAFAPECAGMEPKLISRRVAETALEFGLARDFRKNVEELSGGTARLTALGAALTGDPRLMILDEPTAELDPLSARRLLAEIRRLRDEYGVTIVMSEHRLDALLEFADRLLILDRGSAAFFGAPAELGAALRSGSVPREALADMPGAVRAWAEDADGELPLGFVREKAYFSLHPTVEKQPRARSGGCVCELRNVSFRYAKDAPDVLDGLDLEARAGEILCVCGANGSGKSTLLGVMSRTLRPYAGSVRLFGEKIGKYSSKELYGRTVKLLPQEPAELFDRDTVREQLVGAASASGLDDPKAAAEKALSGRLASIDPQSHPNDLSGGEKQLLALEMLLFSPPKLLLLDEPTKGMDGAAREAFAALLTELTNGEEMTVVAVTHDLDFASLAADRCAMLFDGSVVCVENTAEFFAGNRFYAPRDVRLKRSSDNS